MTDVQDRSNPTSSEIEHEIERSRSKVADTLRELRERMSPGQVVDEVLEYAKTSGGTDVARNLGRSVTENPLPLLLGGSGIAWLLTSSGRPHAGPSVQKIASSSKDMVASGGGKLKQHTGEMTEAAGSFSDSASHTAGAVADQARASGESVRQMADAAVGMGRDAAHSIGEKTSEYADSAKQAAQDASANVQRLAGDAQRTWQRMADEQPLVIGALGVALGALLGAGLPSTGTEDRLMGKASDALKETTMGEASRQFEQVKDVAAETYENVAGEIKEKGLSTESAKHAVDKIGAAATKVADTAEREVEQGDARVRHSGRTTFQTPGSTERSRT
jgi:hypothetical protein